MPSNTIRLTVKTGPGINSFDEGNALAAFLFERCPGNVADAAVLAFLRRCGAEAAAHPGTGAAHHSAAIKRLIEAAGS